MDQCSRHDIPSVLSATLTNQPGHGLCSEIESPNVQVLTGRRLGHHHRRNPTTSGGHPLERAPSREGCREPAIASGATDWHDARVRGGPTKSGTASLWVCVALLAGCGADRAATSTTVSTAVTDEPGYRVDGPLVVAPACGRSGDDCDPGDALLSGVIRFDGSCSFVDSFRGDDSVDDAAAGGPIVALLWMHGAEWDASVDAVRVAPDVVIRDGDVVDVGGGGGSLDNLEHWYPGIEIPAQLAECASEAGVSGFWIGSAVPRSP